MQSAFCTYWSFGHNFQATVISTLVVQSALKIHNLIESMLCEVLWNSTEQFWNHSPLKIAPFLLHHPIYIHGYGESRLLCWWNHVEARCAGKLDLPCVGVSVTCMQVSHTQNINSNVYDIRIFQSEVYSDSEFTWVGGLKWVCQPPAYRDIYIPWMSKVLVRPQRNLLSYIFYW